jgi:hypothetical protein
LGSSSGAGAGGNSVQQQLLSRGNPKQYTRAFGTMFIPLAQNLCDYQQPLCASLITQRQQQKYPDQSG